MQSRPIIARRALDYAVRGFSFIFALVGIVFLVWILWDVASRGLSAMDWNFFTKRTAPHMIEDAGMANAIIGTFYITLFATIIGVPIGMLGGIFLSEFGRQHPVSTVARFFANILMGTPSILIGVFVYTLLVVPFGGFSGFAGGIALAIIMLPVVARTSEDMLMLVPNELRDCDNFPICAVAV
ncbi:MAG: hypothetical protein NTY09_04925 [bacterium]|nr:hypothetical protein [bacterium]